LFGFCVIIKLSADSAGLELIRNMRSLLKQGAQRGGGRGPAGRVQESRVVGARMPTFAQFCLSDARPADVGIRAPFLNEPRVDPATAR
jgi:hypothetical protein